MVIQVLVGKVVRYRYPEFRIWIPIHLAARILIRAQHEKIEPFFKNNI